MEYVDTEMEQMIRSASSTVKPRKEALSTILDKIPVGTPSPYAPKVSAWSGFQKFALVALSICILVGGGSLYVSNDQSETEAPSFATMDARMAMDTSTESAANQMMTGEAPSAKMMSTFAAPTGGGAQPESQISEDTSDEALAQDMETISNEMAAFDEDRTAANEGTL